ncbi:MAG: CHAD domain-containing protein [Gemmatimonadaceae bacterium]
MPSLPPLDPLQQVAHQGARMVALDWLQRLIASRTAFVEAVRAEADALQGVHEGVASGAPAVDALHDARVALRRLRATLATYRVPLDLRVGRRARTALRQLSAATGALRDRDVQGAWLAAEGPGLPPEAQTEAVALATVLRREALQQRDQVAEAFHRDFDRTVQRVQRRLQRYTLACDVGHILPWQPYAWALADALLDEGLTLVRHVVAVGDNERAALHRMRLGLKRHRALLAPFADRHPAITAWLQLATEGQDALGTLRDLVVLRDVAIQTEAPALEAALTDLIATQGASIRTAAWLQRETVTHQIAAAAEALRTLGTAGNAGSRETNPHHDLPAGVPAGVPLEIERKWLLHGLPPVAAKAPVIRIEQGWLPGTALRERLRRTVAADGTETLTRTVKLGPAAARIEVEEPTTPALFAALWPLTAAARIRKRRHLVAAGDRTWEIDVFLDRDLVLAEIELASRDEAVTVPDWLAPFVMRDVTTDPAYLNVTMARPDPAPDLAR